MHQEETGVRFELDGFDEIPYKQFAEAIEAVQEYGRVEAAHMTEDCNSFVILAAIRGDGWDAHADSRELREELCEIAGHVSFRRA